MKRSTELRDAVDEVVHRQADSGVSVVSDGEASKIGYSTYVKERLDGFGGEGGLTGLPSDLTELGLRRSASRPPTRVTSTSGRCSRMSSCPRARC
jgi:methionine synthase II (cobalamin-independent)